MSILEKIQTLVVNGQIIFKYHLVLEKLAEINIRRSLSLTEEDIKEVIFTGEIVNFFDNDKRGRRYAILGFALDAETMLEIICRIENKVVIITVYEPYF